jgi:hypothetical protein
MKGNTTLTMNYINPVTNKTTEIMIYHAFSKITVTTIDYFERINNVLKAIKKEHNSKKRYKINSYRVQILAI